MERLGDDVLALIFNLVHDPNDRKSSSQVCRQWLRVEGLNRLSLRVLEPELLSSFLPRFPNLLKFESSKVVTNSNIEVVAQMCPKLEVLNLTYKETSNGFDEFDDEGLEAIDINDYGVCAVATGCSNLTKVLLRRRLLIGDVGVVSLVNSSRYLTILDLGRCNRLTDEALKAIGAANSLEVLNLQGCWLITDVGLALLASGSLSRTLKKLVIAECDRITDSGLLYLKQMCCLEALNLAECGPKVTDIGGVAIAAIQTLKRLNLSWLINVSDFTLTVLARDCQNLVTVDLTGCESITGYSICSFVNHESLEEIGLSHCHKFSFDDVEKIVLGCQSLKYIALDKRLRKWVPPTLQNNISKKPCWIDWK